MFFSGNFCVFLCKLVKCVAETKRERFAIFVSIFALIFKQILGSVPFLFSKRLWNINEHNIVVYLRDLTNLLGKPAVTSCLRT